MANYSQIRINKTKEMQEMLDFLKDQIKVFSESDIMKLALSELYAKYRAQSGFDWMNGMHRKTKN